MSGSHYNVHLSVSSCMCLFWQYLSTDPLLIPVSLSSVAWPKKAQRCHYLLLFLSPILLSAYSPSIIHVWEQTFVFCLNNWLKAWSEQRESASAWVKSRDEKKFETHTVSSLIPSLSLRQWLNISLLTFSSPHLEPCKVGLVPCSHSLAYFTFSCPDSYSHPETIFCSINPSSNLC